MECEKALFYLWHLVINGHEALFRPRRHCSTSGNVSLQPRRGSSTAVKTTTKMTAKNRERSFKCTFFSACSPSSRAMFTSQREEGGSCLPHPPTPFPLPCHLSLARPFTHHGDLSLCCPNTRVALFSKRGKWMVSVVAFLPFPFLLIYLPSLPLLLIVFPLYPSPTLYLYLSSLCMSGKGKRRTAVYLELRTSFQDPCKQPRTLNRVLFYTLT